MSRASLRIDFALKCLILSHLLHATKKTVVGSDKEAQNFYFSLRRGDVRLFSGSSELCFSSNFGSYYYLSYTEIQFRETADVCIFSSRMEQKQCLKQAGLPPNRFPSADIRPIKLFLAWNCTLKGFAYADITADSPSLIDIYA
jgi:hypothetical protein